MNLNLPSMLFHNAVADAQAKSGTLSDGFGGVERIKNPVRILHAGAAIGDFNTQAASIGICANPNIARAIFLAHGIHGIIENVQDNLLQLMEIAAGDGQARIKIAMDTDVVDLHVIFAKRQGVFEDLIQIDSGPFRFALPGKAEQVLDNVVSSQRLFVKFLDIRSAAFGRHFIGFSS